MENNGDNLINDEYEEIKKVINKNHLIDTILKTSIIAWENKLSMMKIDQWLENFNGEALGDEEVEKRLALWLLYNFVYYPDSAVRALCKAIYKDYIHVKLLEYKEANILQDKGVEERLSHIIENTVFVALGNDSESGSNILYYFRLENKLSKESFDTSFGFYENLVFIDDVTISGKQASDYMSTILINHTNTYLLTFIATKDSIEHFRNNNKVKLVHSILLDDRTKCFSEDSYVFSEPNTKTWVQYAKKLCEHYGEKILLDHPYMKNHPLGFSNGQQLFGFYYNTPDNTIPLFWCDINNWCPAFKRYEKIIDMQEVTFDESSYV